MKSERVFKLLQCTRQTLTKYVKNGKIQTIKLNNGYYEYNDEDIYNILSNNERYFGFYTKLHGSIDQLKSYDNYYKMLDDLLDYKFRRLNVYGYEIDNIEMLSYLCKKYGCNLVVS
jgi:hypothetical protein